MWLLAVPVMCGTCALVRPRVLTNTRSAGLKAEAKFDTAGIMMLPPLPLPRPRDQKGKGKMEDGDRGKNNIRYICSHCCFSSFFSVMEGNIFLP